MLEMGQHFEIIVPVLSISYRIGDFNAVFIARCCA